MSLLKAYVDKEAFSRRLSELIRAFEPCPDKYDAVVAVQSVFDSFPYTTIPADHIGDVNENVRPVVRGKWIADGDGYHWTYNCSICGWKDGYPFNERHNFCPNCGADMREES